MNDQSEDNYQPINRIKKVDDELARIADLKNLAEKPRKLAASFRARYVHYIATGTYFDERGKFERLSERARLERDLKRMCPGEDADSPIVGDLEEERADINRLARRFVYAPTTYAAKKAKLEVHAALEQLNQRYKLPKELVVDMGEFLVALGDARKKYTAKARQEKLKNEKASEEKPIDLKNRIRGHLKNE